MTSRGWQLLRWTLVIGVLALLAMAARRIDWPAAWMTIRHASPGLLIAATLINLLSLVLKGARWWLFLRPIGSPSLGLAIRATAAGAGLNNVLVANGGDAARVVFVSRATGLSGAAVLATLAVERLLDSVGYLVLFAVSAALLTFPPALQKWRVPALSLIVLLAVLTWVLVRRRRGAPVEAALAGAPDLHAPRAMTVVGRLRAESSQFIATAREISTGPRLAIALALSLAAWACQIATFALVADAAGAPLPLAGDIATLLATNLSLIVRATPGNVGVFQLAYAVTAGSFGVARAPAVASSVLIQVLQIVPVTLLGIALAPQFVFGRAGKDGRPATAQAARETRGSRAAPEEMASPQRGGGEPDASS